MYLLAEGLHLNVDTTDGDRQEGVCPVGPMQSEDTLHMTTLIGVHADHQEWVKRKLPF